MSITMNDDVSWQRFARKTAGGRNILYDIAVLQQPQHARACGSGPKSSADRRPVDPPPIIRLNIFEGESWDNCKDITFDYNADFFLYVSLEHARPMAHGRVQTPAATSPPVLTGSPVSSCCFLDRPDPAGYFLFPDLSVRHEGRYKLVFNLFEQIKDPMDADAVAKSPDSDGLQHEDTELYEHRATIYSEAFTVYSAKKFPGLSTSTHLSRTIAEQGCRVRIRRDVRMRRRETKASNTTDFEKREDEYMTQRRTQSPAEAFRARSASNSSVDRASYTGGLVRRPSGHEYGPPPPPHTPISGGALQFGQGAVGYKIPAVPASGSTPVSPAHPPYTNGSYTYAPPPTPSRYAPTGPQYSARSPIIPDDGRRSLTYQGSSFGGPAILPRLIMASKPSMEARSPIGSMSQPSSSPLIASRKTSLSAYSTGPLLQQGRATKRPFNEKSKDHEKLVYPRASGQTAEKDGVAVRNPTYHHHEPQGNSMSDHAIDPALAAVSAMSDDEHEYLQNGLMGATLMAVDAHEHARKRRFKGPA